MYDDGLGTGESFATVNEFGSIDFAAMNRGVRPVFFHLDMPDAKTSEECGRPRFMLQECVRIVVAGDGMNQGVFPVDEAMKRRFSTEYAAWKAGSKVVQITGTPLSQWPAISRTFLRELEALGIMSVEDLAGLSDTNIKSLDEGMAWRAKAQAYLAAATDSSAIARYAADNSRMKEEIAELRARLDLVAPVVDKVSHVARKVSVAPTKRTHIISDETRAKRAQAMRRINAVKAAARGE